jgi:(E)-4-hydroxy-3-methylbut-2-enyl-diphosphate synthase
LVEEVEEFIQTMQSPLKVAVMGCCVNGPGEAREADIGVAGGRGVGIIFKKGEIFKKVSEEELLPVFMQELRKMEEERRQDRDC